MIQAGVKNREAVKATLARGMKELTGADDGTEAWRSFFEAGDVVGIKVVPNGYPQAHTSYELILEVIEGLKSAGVKTRDILVFDRYKHELIAAKIPEILPAGIRWGGLTPGGYDETQLHDDLAGRRPDRRLRPRRVHGDEPRPQGPRPEGRPQPPLAPGPRRHPAGQQARDAARRQGPRLGGRHRGAQEHEPRPR